VRRLDGHLGVDPSFLDEIQQREVVLGDRIGVGGILDVLSQVRERRGDVIRGESFCGLDRILHPLTRHESRDHRANEPIAREMRGEPPVPRGEEDPISCRIHPCFTAG
jgi:hypothetical protein